MKNRRPRLGARGLVAACAVAMALAAACGRGRYVPAVEWGAELFRSPDLSDSAFNELSCATCHATTDAPPSGFIPSGYTMRDVAFRESWWGGYETTLLDAVNFCFVYFMRGDAFTPEDARGRALYEYLASLSPTRPAPALPLTVVENLTVVDRGDPVRGKVVYEGACGGCHGSFPAGRGRLGRFISRLGDAFEEYPIMFPGIDPALVVVEKIRHGQFFGIGGNMPLFSAEALSDDDLGALLAYFDPHL